MRLLPRSHLSPVYRPPPAHFVAWLPVTARWMVHQAWLLVDQTHGPCGDARERGPTTPPVPHISEDKEMVRDANAYE